ncbi:putative 1,4-benzoquinone reductase [Conidiobolus coronatus NRRL 28638]|uniref:Putative 1,4-benzoquinone reductase n=1 Tax=Conidiobolus coronatus (strain ATCC 28846 / CBS 209.66 / NRRL 28638) TaxID=796925 RepID=A0A137NZ75_CONC2|nr:putative 1,4-benzoquinone reductase [Conidiobolus coronatus NRRL 28638]|eukprot:KXN67899.1 putative 1,4-benzoquinone reductase [Conidiobolus coronatus NRRL 28638]
MALARVAKVAIPYYSTYGHIHQLAKAIKEGADKVPNVDAKLYRIPETLPKEILEKIHAAPPTSDPEITTDILAAADGFLFGYPTRFGSFPSQVKSFIDSTGALWATKALYGKFAGTFVSSNSQHGGQETTHLALINWLAHNAISYVPLGYASDHINNDKVITGGSPYGASTIAGENGSRQPTDLDLETARIQGENFAKLVSTYVKGKEAGLLNSKI